MDNEPNLHASDATPSANMEPSQAMLRSVKRSVPAVFFCEAFDVQDPATFHAACPVGDHGEGYCIALLQGHLDMVCYTRPKLRGPCCIHTYVAGSSCMPMPDACTGTDDLMHIEALSPQFFKPSTGWGLCAATPCGRHGKPGVVSLSDLFRCVVHGCPSLALVNWGLVV